MQSFTLSLKLDKSILHEIEYTTTEKARRHRHVCRLIERMNGDSAASSCDV